MQRLSKPLRLMPMSRSIGLQTIGEPGGLRVTGQLIDAETGAHLWADRFDGLIEDVFELQDKIATSVAGVIEPALQAAEMRRSAAQGGSAGAAGAASAADRLAEAQRRLEQERQQQEEADARRNPVSTEPESVASGRNLDEITGNSADD